MWNCQETPRPMQLVSSTTTNTAAGSASFLGVRLGSQEAALLFFQLSHKGAFMETSGCYCVNQAIQERSFPAGSACNWSRVGRLRKTLPQASNMCGLLRKQSGWETGWMRGFTVAFVRNVCGRGPYIVPFGWCKLALRISDEPKTHMATWAPAFHGTKLARILQILRPPDGGRLDCFSLATCTQMEDDIELSRGTLRRDSIEPMRMPT